MDQDDLFLEVELTGATLHGDDPKTVSTTTRAPPLLLPCTTTGRRSLLRGVLLWPALPRSACVNADCSPPCDASRSNTTRIRCAAAHDWPQAARSSAHACGVWESQVQISRGMEQVWFKEYRFSQVPQHSQRAPIDVHIHPCGSPAQYGLCAPPRWQHLLVLSPRVHSVPPIPCATPLSSPHRVR
jgi:hypothetical protein